VNARPCPGVLAGVPHVAILAAQFQFAETALTSAERFAALVSRQSRFVFQVAWAVLRNGHDAEDVVQETFLKLYRTGSWERIEDERAFLARTAWRLAVARTRGRRTSSVIEDPSDAAPGPEREAIAADLHSAVQRLIDALPEDLRVPLALSAIDELSSPRIAEMMGIPEGTVRTRIMRAREILRKKLEAL
jgi:RNA polymerase sigma-70 factor (ECF subfamily)